MSAWSFRIESKEIRMKQHIFNSLLLVTVTGVAAADEAAWLSNYDEAKQVAKQKNAPMFVVFR